MLALWGLAMSQAVLWVLTGTLPTPDATWAAGVSTGSKLLVFSPALVLCWTAGRSIVAAQLLALGVLGFAVLDVGVLPAGADRPPTSLVAPLVLLQMLIWIGPWLLLSAQPRQILKLQPRPHRALTQLAVPAAFVERSWAVKQNAQPLLPVRHAFALEAHGSITELTALLAVLTLLSALRPRGRTWPVLAVTVAAAWIAAWSIALPNAWASPGRAWGAVLLMWALTGLVLRSLNSRS